MASNTFTILLPVFAMIAKTGRFAQVWAPDTNSQIGTLGIQVKGLDENDQTIIKAMGLTSGTPTATIDMSAEDFGYLDHINGIALSPAINAGGTQLLHMVEGFTQSKSELLAFWSPNSMKARKVTIARKAATKLGEDGKLFITEGQDGRQYQNHCKAACNPMKQQNMEDAYQMLAEGAIQAIARTVPTEKVSTPRSTKSKVLSGM